MYKTYVYNPFFGYVFFGKLGLSSEFHDIEASPATPFFQATYYIRISITSQYRISFKH